VLDKLICVKLRNFERASGMVPEIQVLAANTSTQIVKLTSRKTGTPPAVRTFATAAPNKSTALGSKLSFA
jgi:hypothetical protein